MQLKVCTPGVLKCGRKKMLVMVRFTDGLGYLS